MDRSFERLFAYALDKIFAGALPTLEPPRRVASRIAIAACALIIPAVAFAQTGANDGCTNATLKGDYGFRVTGNVLNAAGTPVQNREGVAMTHFDGKGNLTQVDFTMVNGVPQSGPSDPVTGFYIDEWGTYTVNSDCTGSAVIHFPVPPGGTSGAELNVVFVLSNGWRTIHAIVTKAIPPNSSTPVPVSIHGDAEKLQPISVNR
jgi:hypothetical protein